MNMTNNQSVLINENELKSDLINNIIQINQTNITTDTNNSNITSL